MRTIVHVLRRVNVDCSNQGITSQFEMLWLTDETDPPEMIGTLPVLKLVKQESGYLYAEPVKKSPKSSPFMAGGNFIYSSGSNFRKQVNTYPISVHDRQE